MHLLSSLTLLIVSVVPTLTSLMYAFEEWSFWAFILSCAIVPLHWVHGMYLIIFNIILA